MDLLRNTFLLVRCKKPDLHLSDSQKWAFVEIHFKGKKYEGYYDVTNNSYAYFKSAKSWYAIDSSLMGCKSYINLDKIERILQSKISSKNPLSECIEKICKEVNKSTKCRIHLN